VLLGRHASEPAQAWHVRWTQVAEALRAVARELAGRHLAREPVDAAVQPFAAVRSRPVSGQLAPPPQFTDRDSELAVLDRWLPALPDHRMRGVMLITGTAGVGKTALAHRWLSGLGDRFPDGELCADLRGFGAEPPRMPAEMLERFLGALGVPPERVPGSLDGQTALYQSLIAGRRMLVLLDDAASTAQVRPLLPASADSVVVVTSRRRLGGLLVAGAGLLTLEPLREAAAVELLARFVGAERVDAELVAARALVGLCGCLPIALSVAAARLVARPKSRIERMVVELRGEWRRLDALSVEDVSVQAAFDVSYQALPPDAARLYRMVGLLPGTDFDRAVVAAAADLPVEEADRLLGVLVEASMLEERGEDRYGLHDLLRLHARAHGQATEAPAERHAAARRALNWYLAGTTAADRAVTPQRRRHPRPYAYPAAPAGSFDGARDALAWLEAERSNLLDAVRLAAERELHTTAWQLVDSMWSLFLYHKHYHEWIESHLIGIAAARADGDWAGETMLLNHLGLAFHGLGRFGEAHEYFEQALASHREMGDRQGEATALNSLGLALDGLGRTQEAISHFIRAARMHRELGDRRGEALNRVNLGRAFSGLGDGAKAYRHLTSARSAFAALSDRYNEARVLHSLGRLYARDGQAGAAVDHLLLALVIMRELGSPFEEAQVLEILGDAVRLTGDECVARHHYQRALVLYQQIGGPHAGWLRDRVNSEAGYA
jgi:tetratricopeptide (TPR) repeat protein